MKLNLHRGLALAFTVGLLASCGAAVPANPTAQPGQTAGAETDDPSGGFTFPPFEQPTPAAEGGTPSNTRWRVANLMTRDGEPLDVDVVSQNAQENLQTAYVLRATVPYGEASDFFDPGLAELGGDHYVVMDIRAHGEQTTLISAASRDSMEPNDSATVIVTADELFDQMAPSQMIFFHDLRNFALDAFDPAKGTVIVMAWGVPEPDDGSDGDEYLYAAVGGDSCLPNAQAGDQEFTFGQPIALGTSGLNPMAVDPGSHQLTFHRQDPGEDFAQCQNDAVGPSVPIEVGAGEHVLVLLYGTSVDEMQPLVLPGDE